MFNYSSNPTITNCSFLGNAATEYDDQGGGMYNESSSPSISNCSFSGNNAANGGGIFNVSATPTITNSIIWNNNTGIQGTSATVTYSIVQGATADATSRILTQDPLFVDATSDNLRLQACSPAIDKGSNTAVPNGVTTDLDGNSRIVNITVDMGAYEYSGTPCATCSNATNLTTSNITSSSATLNWVAGVNPQAWQVQYKSTTPGAKWKDVKINNQLPTGDRRSVTVTDLRPNQSYMWHIRARCSGTWTKYSDSVGFKTQSRGAATDFNALTLSETVEEMQGLQVKVLSNPSTSYFTLVIHSSDSKAVGLQRW